MERNDTEDKWSCYMMWAIGFVLLVMIVSFFVIYKCIDCWEHRGQFGDLFGVVNALFSGLAFAGLIITIRQQHLDLEYQSQSIAQTKQELENQTREFNEQNETLRIQRFENTFFKMLEVQQSIVNDLYAADSHKERVEEVSPDNYRRLSKEILAQDEYRGRNLFYYVFLRCPHFIPNYYKTGGDREVYGLREVIKYRGMLHIEEYLTLTMFDHYFRHLYTILKFITQNDWLGKEKQYQYSTFVRATLSRFELVMLYYNGFFHPKMKKMMERYCLLNNIRTYYLPVSKEFEDYLENGGLAKKDVRQAGFTCSDFEFYLTDDVNDKTKYHLSAFYTEQEVKVGEEHLNKWKAFVGKNKK